MNSRTAYKPAESTRLLLIHNSKVIFERHSSCCCSTIANPRKLFFLLFEKKRYDPNNLTERNHACISTVPWTLIFFALINGLSPAAEQPLAGSGPVQPALLPARVAACYVGLYLYHDTIHAALQAACMRVVRWICFHEVLGNRTVLTLTMMCSAVQCSWSLVSVS